MTQQRPNIICIMSDTFRARQLGGYGGGDTLTPNLNVFARQAAVFEAAYPESLPTIPVRRALFTGRRAYPFRNYRPLPWDIVYLPGWQPISHQEDTLAERLAEAGYHTGFVSDTLPFFQPGMNFHRGFYQWEYVRGLQQDRWRSPLLATPERMKKYRHRENPDRSFLENDVTYRHVANNVWIEKEEDHPTARVYQWAMEFVQQNAGLQPFYLYLDTFPPHEPWEAPASFYQKYADPSYSGETIIHCYYGAAKNWYTEQEVRNIYAHYRGLCSLVDYWFGQFWKVLEQEKILDNTLVVFLSDHGTNFPWENEEGIIGKPAYALFPAVMSLPLMVRFPDGAGAGRCFSSFVYNIDVTATIYAAAGLANKVNIEGQNLRKLIFSGNWQEREYLTSRYGEYLWYRDRKHWVVLTSQGKGKYVFDVEADPNCQRNLAADRKEVVGKAYRCCLQDAGGEIPVYSEGTFTDAIGQKVKE